MDMVLFSSLLIFLTGLPHKQLNYFLAALFGCFVASALAASYAPLPDGTFEFNAAVGTYSLIIAAALIYVLLIHSKAAHRGRRLAFVQHEVDRLALAEEKEKRRLVNIEKNK